MEQFKNQYFESSSGLTPEFASFARIAKKYLTTELSTGASYKFPIDQVRKKLGGDSQINRKSNLDKLLE